jgi:hypothetical protein
MRGGHGFEVVVEAEGDADLGLTARCAARKAGRQRFDATLKLGLAGFSRLVERTGPVPEVFGGGMCTPVRRRQVALPTIAWRKRCAEGREKGARGRRLRCFAAGGPVGVVAAEPVEP